jgi:hypothetical protein
VELQVDCKSRYQPFFTLTISDPFTELAALEQVVSPTRTRPAGEIFSGCM